MGRTDKSIRVESFSQDGRAIICVVDNGPGLPDDIQAEELFDPFFSTKKSGKGTGLGLAIVRMFVDRFEGKINVERVSPQGAKFTVSLPLAPDDISTTENRDGVEES